MANQKMSEFEVCDGTNVKLVGLVPNGDGTFKNVITGLIDVCSKSDLTLLAPIDNPVFTGKPTAPTPDGTVEGQVTTVEYVKDIRDDILGDLADKADLDSPVFTGAPTTPDPADMSSVPAKQIVNYGTMVASVDESIETLVNTLDTVAYKRGIFAYAVDPTDPSVLIDHTQRDKLVMVTGDAVTTETEVAPVLEDISAWTEGDSFAIMNSTAISCNLDAGNGFHPAVVLDPGKSALVFADATNGYFRVLEWNVTDADGSVNVILNTTKTVTPSMADSFIIQDSAIDAPTGIYNLAISASGWQKGDTFTVFNNGVNVASIIIGDGSGAQTRPNVKLKHFDSADFTYDGTTFFASCVSRRNEFEVSTAVVTTGTGVPVAPRFVNSFQMLTVAAANDGATYMLPDTTLCHNGDTFAVSIPDVTGGGVVIIPKAGQHIQNLPVGSSDRFPLNPGGTARFSTDAYGNWYLVGCSNNHHIAQKAIADGHVVAIHELGRVLTIATNGTTMTLPGPTTVPTSQVLVINNATGTVHVDVTGTSTEFTLTSGKTAMLLNNGTKWYSI